MIAMCRLLVGGGFDPHAMLFLAGWPLVTLIAVAALLRIDGACRRGVRSDFDPDADPFDVPEELPA